MFIDALCGPPSPEQPARQGTEQLANKATIARRAWPEIAQETGEVEAGCGLPPCRDITYALFGAYGFYGRCCVSLITDRNLVR